MFQIFKGDEQIGVAEGKSIDHQSPDLGLCSIYLDRALFIFDGPVDSRSRDFLMWRLVKTTLFDPDRGITYGGCLVAAFDKSFFHENAVIIEGLTLFYHTKTISGE